MRGIMNPFYGFLLEFSNGFNIVFGRGTGGNYITLPITFIHLPYMFGIPHLWSIEGGNPCINVQSRNISGVVFQTRWNGGASNYPIDYLVIGY